GHHHSRHHRQGSHFCGGNWIDFRDVSGDSGVAVESDRSVADGMNMVVGEAIRTSLEEVKGHPLRSFFTLIGVILGTLALVVVLSVLDGVEAAVWQGVEDLGMDGVIAVSPRKPTDRVEQAKAHLSRGLRVEDGKYFENSDIITSIGPVGETRAVVTAGTVTRRVDIYGITPSFVNIKGRKPSDERSNGVADAQDTRSV